MKVNNNNSVMLQIAHEILNAITFIPKEVYAFFTGLFAEKVSANNPYDARLQANITNKKYNPIQHGKLNIIKSNESNVQIANLIAKQQLKLKPVVECDYNPQKESVGKVLVTHNEKKTISGWFKNSVVEVPVQKLEQALHLSAEEKFITNLNIKIESELSLPSILERAHKRRESLAAKLNSLIQANALSPNEIALYQADLAKADNNIHDLETKLNSTSDFLRKPETKTHLETAIANIRAKIANDNVAINAEADAKKKESLKATLKQDLAFLKSLLKSQASLEAFLQA